MARAKAKTKEKSQPQETTNEIHVFEEFTNDEVKIISKYSEKKFYQREEVVFEEKSKDASLYVVLKGHLKVYAHTQSKEKIHLSNIDVGEVFGELSFLDGKPRSATILAMEDVELLQITREDFQRLRENYPAIASKLILDLARVVSLRLRNADKFIVDIFHLVNKDEQEPAKKEKVSAKKAKALEVTEEAKTSEKSSAKKAKAVDVKGEKKTPAKKAPAKKSTVAYIAKSKKAKK